jgi:DEAD/DEAH box helicase domain-containing protein
MPGNLAAPLQQMLERRGIQRLYTHQAEAFELASAGKNVVVVTPTASGKTLCYNLPVLNRIVEDTTARAIYLFPTKALAEDQVH